VKNMPDRRPKLFRGRHFMDEMIVLCVRWYLRYSLSYRDLEEMMAERGAVAHSTIGRWVLAVRPGFGTNPCAVIVGLELRGGWTKPMFE
jgi:hypothetical protein